MQDEASSLIARKNTLEEIELLDVVASMALLLGG